MRLCLAVHCPHVHSQILEESITSRVKPAKIPSFPTCPKRWVKEDNRSTFRSEVKCWEAKRNPRMNRVLNTHKDGTLCPGEVTVFLCNNLEMCIWRPQNGSTGKWTCMLSWKIHVFKVTNTTKVSLQLDNLTSLTKFHGGALFTSKAPSDKEEATFWRKGYRTQTSTSLISLSAPGCWDPVLLGHLRGGLF